MIFDCFTFYNEYDILEGRLEYLYDVVDKFVIVEADRTFVGNEKPLNYLSNISRYEKYRNKIIYQPYHIDLSKYSMSDKNVAWKIEKDQRDIIGQVVCHFGDEDIILLGDVDEIPKKQSIYECVDLLNKGHDVLAIIQHLYSYSFRWRQRIDPNGYGYPHGFPQTVVFKNKFGRGKDFNTIRSFRSIYPYVPFQYEQGGWHLTNWGSPEFILNKIQNFSHQEINTEYRNTPDKILHLIRNKKLIFDGENEQRLIDVNVEEIDEEAYNIFSKYEYNYAGMM